MPNVIPVRNEYTDAAALKNVLKYVLRTNMRGGYGVDPDMAYQLMAVTKRAYHAEGGVQLKHFLVTFSEHELLCLDWAEIMALGFEVGQFFREYQMVYGLHRDTDHAHLHFVMNTTSFLDGHKYSDGLSKFNGLCRYLRERFPKFETKLYQTESFSAAYRYTKGVNDAWQSLD